MITRPELIIILFFGFPLLLLLWLSLKIEKAYLRRIRILKHNNQDYREDHIKVIVLAFVITIFLLLILFLLISIFIPNIISPVPIVIKMLIMIFIIVIYSCFAAFFLGLKNVVGAGGSATEVLKSLSNYISELSNIDNTEVLNKDLKDIKKNE